MNQKEINEGIIRVLRDFGSKHEGRYIMSVWELTSNLNNAWYSKFFYRKGYKPKGAEKYFRDWAFPSFNLGRLRLRVLRYLERLSWATKFGDSRYGDYFAFEGVVVEGESKRAKRITTKELE